ncbi:hypothetical protein EJB05_20554 [Eragrostis curvula]|uniref:Helicase C-terminal domain-containing protein n=1 Tax=Eragrostis curvula TaxID=38414 RepID=A0A5J9UYM9_9POAL|nr:hypothetical protein EJB05_20554 [Eragrostis curvula]
MTMCSSRAECIMLHALLGWSLMTPMAMGRKKKREDGEMGEEVGMEVDGEGSSDSGEASEQVDGVVGENRKDGNGDRHDNEDQSAAQKKFKEQAAAIGATPDDVEEQQERKGDKEQEEEEDDSEETHSVYEGDGEDGEEDSEGEEVESDGTGEAQARTPSNAMLPAGSAMSRGGSRHRTPSNTMVPAGSAMSGGRSRLRTRSNAMFPAGSAMSGGGSRLRTRSNTMVPAGSAMSGGSSRLRTRSNAMVPAGSAMSGGDSRLRTRSNAMVPAGSAMAAGSSMSAGGSRAVKKRVFEGLVIVAKPLQTIGEGITGRTRSKRKCTDTRLLKRGIFSKPVLIDVLDSSSESEEEPPPPPLQPAWQGVLSSSEDYSNEGRRKRRRRRKNSRGKKKAGSSSDEFEVKIKGQGFRRLRRGMSKRQAGKEGGKNYDGSNPGRGRYNGQNGARTGNISSAQDDLSFKKHSNLTQSRKHQSTRAKAAYDELLNSLFEGWENHINGSVPADASGNTLPLRFSFGDEDEVDKSDNDKCQEELWGDFDAALESINTDAHGNEEDDTCNRQKVPPGEAFSCKHGRHEFIIDDQVGVRCKHCNVVELEIRYVLPSMGKYATERAAANPEVDLLFKDMLNLFEKNDLLVSNGSEGEFLPCARKTGSVWDLIPGVKEDMFLHQQDAFEFVWRKLAGSTDVEEIEALRRTASTDIGGGCVISHAPGTGKTRLAITFVQSYLELFPQCCPVIIAPRAMLATWEREFKKWNVKLPFHVLNSTEINCSDDKTIRAKIDKDGSFARRLLSNKMDQNYRRLVKLTSWVNGTSIIGVSYSLFRKLANDEGMDGDNVQKLLLQKPDLLVLDEGHTPRNKKSLIWKVLSQVRTEKRIILSGTVFQNNFEELYNTLYLVRPKDAELLEKNEGRDWTSLRLSNITDENIDKIREKLEPVVHYHKGNFLEKSLPGLKETVVILNPLPRQKEIIASMEKTAAMGTLDAEYKISLALVHPSLITSAKLSEREACLVDKALLKSIRWDPSEGVKTRFVVEVIQQCQDLNERVLVFSQYLEPLSLIMGQLKKRFNWTEDREILQMSGNVRVKQREDMMAAFNNMKSEAKVMLASTKACCEGITLVGASRVVLLDVVWNPSVGRQAIGRAYRFGQKKVVYTYNLIADGTKEMDKYSRQAKKEHMSKMLFSNEEQAEECNISPESTFSDKVLEAMTANEDLKDLIVEIRVENQTDGSIRDAEEMEKENTQKDVEEMKINTPEDAEEMETTDPVI